MALVPRPIRDSKPALAADTLAVEALGPSRARLVAFSTAVMENLHQQLASPTVAVILADREGAIIAVVGPRNGSLNPATFDSASAGSSATALPSLNARLPCMADAPPSGRALALGAENGVLMGLTSPILAPDGGMLGIVDLCSSPFDNLSHATALLHTTVSIIEHRLIASDERGFLMLHFHSCASVLDTPLEALILFARDSRLLAANQVATALLSIAPTTEELRCPDCFDAQWPGLVGGAALQPDEAFTIHSCAGTPFFARARLRATATAPWPTP